MFIFARYLKNKILILKSFNILNKLKFIQSRKIKLDIEINNDKQLDFEKLEKSFD